MHFVSLISDRFFVLLSPLHFRIRHFLPELILRLCLMSPAGTPLSREHMNANFPFLGELSF